MLTSYLEIIMDAVFSSVDKCPNLLRIALRQLWMRVADRFQDPEHVVSVRWTDRQRGAQRGAQREAQRGAQREAQRGAQRGAQRRAQRGAQRGA